MTDKSKDMGAVEAAEFIELMKTPEEIKGFLSEDENRKTVLAAAETRINKLMVDAANANPPKPPEEKATIIATEDCFRYHPDQAPKIFRKGEVIPEGWTIEASKLWVCDESDKWKKV